MSEPSELTKKYYEKAKQFEDAALEYNARRIDALTADDARSIHFWSSNANILRNRVKTAMSDWVSNGYKNDFEQISAFIDQVMQRDLSLLKQEYRDDLEKARLTGIASGSDFFYSSLVPGNFARSGGWTRFSFKSGDLQSRSSSTFQNKRWAVAGGVSYLGIFGGRANASRGSARQEYQGTFSSDDFELSFEITQVQIERPWLHRSFMLSPTWRFDQGSPEVKDERLSDGGAPPRGLLPAYPTSIVFVRNLVMTIGHSESFSNYVREQQQSSAGGGGYVAFGPFFLGGSGSNLSSTGSTTRDWGYKFERNGIQCPGMQIAGFKCHVLPEAPKPLASITNWI